MEPFPFCLPSSHLNSCYYHQDLHRRRFDLGSHLGLLHHRCALLQVETNTCSPRRPGVGAMFQCHPFSGWLIRQVSCYTLLSGFRLLWPPSCCLDQPTPFLGSDERQLRHLNLAFSSSRIASSAYQEWPTWNPGIPWRTSLEQDRLLTYLKFENRLRLFQPQGL